MSSVCGAGLLLYAPCFAQQYTRWLPIRVGHHIAWTHISYCSNITPLTLAKKSSKWRLYSTIRYI